MKARIIGRKAIPLLLMVSTLSGCAATMYSRPLAPGEEPADLETIVAIDLLAFDGTKPVRSSWNSWQVSPGSHQLTARAHLSNKIWSSPRTTAFTLEQGHNYWLGLRAYDMEEVEKTPAGTVYTGKWELALYDKTASCVVLDGSNNCIPYRELPWARGWEWSARKY